MPNTSALKSNISFQMTSHQVKIHSEKKDYSRVPSRCGSMSNATHRAGGGNVKVTINPLITRLSLPDQLTALYHNHIACNWLISYLTWIQKLLHIQYWNINLYHGIIQCTALLAPPVHHIPKLLNAHYMVYKIMCEP